jgi:transposase InsO family protein
MGWKERDVVSERQDFNRAYLKHEETFKDLCARFGVSEKTGHKWKNRFIEHGIHALEDESRAPLSSPQQLSEDAVIRLIRLRTVHPSWGAKKLNCLYQKAYPAEEAPSVSSIQRVLGKAGLIDRRPIRTVNPSANRLQRPIRAELPNDVWTVDFKGWWLSGGERCIPLTVRDAASRYILDIRLMSSTDGKAVRIVFENLFRKYGLPKTIHSDNGSPFASRRAPLGLSRLSCWWITLGIFPERSAPGRPTDNGAHERLHADIAREIERKIPGGIAANQAVLDEWRKEFNEIRPHEALGMQTPAQAYHPSERRYECDFASIEYPLGFEARKVLPNGQITYEGMRVSLSTALCGCIVGLQPMEDGSFHVWLADFFLGVFDRRTGCFSADVELESEGKPDAP